MQVVNPYVDISAWGTGKQVVRYDENHGRTYRDMPGEHAIWAARMPFLPAMMSDDFKSIGHNRVDLIVRRQLRFIYNLANAKQFNSTFELRFISRPSSEAGFPNQIDIVFFGKVFSTKQGAGYDLSLKLWDHFSSVFPIEDPFNYPLQPVTDQNEFHRYFQPVNLETLGSQNLIEIRKYEDKPIISSLERISDASDYIPHPFVPNVDFSPMSGFLTTLSNQTQKCWVSISIRPLSLFDNEVVNLSARVGSYMNSMRIPTAPNNEHIRFRAEVGHKIYQNLIKEREQLFTLRISIVGERSAPRGLVEALGSELMGNASNNNPTQWSLVQPRDHDDLTIAVRNLIFIEQDDWGFSIAPSWRDLRYFATAQEVYGAFRLPVPPESGYMPGILVKDEPFTAPIQTRSVGTYSNSKTVSLGTIYHRGNPSTQTYDIKVDDLTRHTLIAGSTGSGKTSTIKHLLSQLWESHQIPFLILYPVDKPDYRDLLFHDGIKDDLLIFTLGDENVSPFRFNPFEVPNGVLLKTHLSHLMRVFTSVFALVDPLPMIYRDALRRVYKQYEWNTVKDRGESNRNYPLMSDFYQAIQEIADNLDYGGEVKANVRQASVIRIADLLENAGQTINTERSFPFSTLLSKPAVMELGRVGSSEDINLVMGFLMIRLAEEFAQNPRSVQQPHITVIEEAHRLMPESQSNGYVSEGRGRASASEDFSNLLSEVRGYGEGIIIAEQIPTSLVKSAVGNTYTKIMHWIEDATSFEMFSEILNLNEQQRNHVRTFESGFAVIRDSYGHPVQVRVPSPKESSEPDDDEIASAMVYKRKLLGIEDQTFVEWEAGLSATPSRTINQRQIADRLLNAPMQTCAFCKGWMESGKCLHRHSVRRIFAIDTFDWRHIFTELEQASMAQTSDEKSKMINAVAESLGLEDAEEVYCLLAHMVAEKQKVATADAMVNYRKLLKEYK
jgi:hypothetical protein